MLIFHGLMSNVSANLKIPDVKCIIKTSRKNFGSLKYRITYIFPAKMEIRVEGKGKSSLDGVFFRTAYDYARAHQTLRCQHGSLRH